MENLRQLLAVIAAAVLVLSVISGTNFVSYRAFADDDEDDKNSNSGKGNSDDEEDDDNKSGSSNNDQEDDDSASSSDEDDEERNDYSKGKSDDERSVQNGNATSSNNDDEDDEKSNSGKGSNDDDDDEKSGKDEKVKEERHEEERKVKLEVEDDGVEVEVELNGMTFADGAYDAAFVCDSPAVNMTFANSFEVKGGEGEFDKEITLANGTYTGCQLEVDGTVVATFNAFTVADDDVEEKRKERRQTIVSTANATKIHERHVNANPESPGNYTQGSDYVLVANGTAEDDGADQSATINATMSVWKSTSALVLLDMTGGTAKLGNNTYDIAIGYALYSINSGAMRITALVVDDSGDILKLKLRGDAEQGEFPLGGGDSLDLSFEGNSGQGRNNSLGSWELELEATVRAS